MLIVTKRSEGQQIATLFNPLTRGPFLPSDDDATIQLILHHLKRQEESFEIKDEKIE